MAKKIVKIGKTWKTRMRIIDGKKRKVKVRKVGKRVQVRVFGHRNTSDKATSKKNKARRVARFANTTDSKRHQYRI